VGPDGRTTLFGRGGSDYSAAALARCIGASSLDVWKDVRGFLSADPREVGEPMRIANLSYSEAAELSYFGARILHPRTVEPLFDRGIPVRVLDVDAWKPGDPMVPGTIIDGSGQIAKGRVKAVSSSEDIGILTLQGPGVGFKRGILAQATGSLDDRGINIKSVITAQTAINILVGREDLVEARKTLVEHHVAGVVDLSTNNDASIVAIVGEGILDGTPPLALASRALQAVSAAGIHVFLATAGASDVALYLLVPRSERLATVRRIHAEFFGGSA
jgi:aspartate kinase/aspartokinase/homoserine dehydrogenase 1